MSIAHTPNPDPTSRVITPAAVPMNRAFAQSGQTSRPVIVFSKGLADAPTTIRTTPTRQSHAYLRESVSPESTTPALVPGIPDIDAAERLFAGRGLRQAAERRCPYHEPVDIGTYRSCGRATSIAVCLVLNMSHP